MHTKKVSADTAKTSSNFEKKNSEYESQINFMKSHQILQNLDELIKRYKAKYTRGKFRPLPHHPSQSE